jgi:hypothetical protein
MVPAASPTTGVRFTAGQGGDDTFVIGLGRGDVVRDFEIGSDLLDLSAWSANDFADLRITETEGQISIRDADRQLVRIDRGETGLSAADFASDSFIFVDTLMA